jgi:hypothetical protein
MPCRTSLLDSNLPVARMPGCAMAFMKTSSLSASGIEGRTRPCAKSHKMWTPLTCQSSCCNEEDSFALHMAGHVCGGPEIVFQFSCVLPQQPALPTCRRWQHLYQCQLGAVSAFSTCPASPTKNHSCESRRPGQGISYHALHSQHVS